MNIKYGTITKKINDVVNIIYPKSSSNMIDHNNTTVKTALEDIANDLLTLSSQTSTIDSRISTACNNLYNRIVGTVDNYTINEVYDTLTEISQYLEEHEDVVSGFINDIGDLQDQDTAIKNVITYIKLLEQFHTDFAPKDINDELHPLFIKSCQEISFTQYLYDCMIQADENEWQDIFKTNKKEVERIVEEVQKIRSTKKS